MHCTQHAEMVSKLIHSFKIYRFAFTNISNRDESNNNNNSNRNDNDDDRKKKHYSFCIFDCKTQLIVSSSNCVYFIRFDFRRHRNLSLSYKVSCHFTAASANKFFVYLCNKVVHISKNISSRFRFATITRCQLWCASFTLSRRCFFF